MNLKTIIYKSFRNACLFGWFAALTLFSLAGCENSKPTIYLTSHKEENASPKITESRAQMTKVVQTKLSIPKQPKKLQFPPLTYKPPSTNQYQIQLKSKPIAYIISNHKLPLININILIHI